jgi:acylphosphatase
MQQAHVFISGNVQGIGYRQFVKSNARKLNLTGWVQNTEDRGVEAIFQGEKEMIEVMLDVCKKGPILAEVEYVGFDWEEPEKYTDFEIRN